MRRSPQNGILILTAACFAGLMIGCPPMDNTMPTPTASPTASPSDSPTASPTATPTASPTATPTASPTATPTPTPVVGVVADGETKFTTSLCSLTACSACHGADGSGASAPDILDTSADDLETELVDGPHGGGVWDCLDAQDYADLEAFLGQ